MKTIAAVVALHQRIVRSCHQAHCRNRRGGAQQPQIASAAHLRSRRRRQRVAGIGRGLGRDLEILDAHIDLADRETGHLEVEIEFDFRQCLQLLRQKLVVPSCDFAQAVIGDRKSAHLRLVQVVDSYGGDLRPAELLRRQDAAVSGDHLEVGVDQHWHVESERRDAARDLAYLLRAVGPRVLRVGLQLRNWPIRYCDSRRPVCF